MHVAKQFKIKELSELSPGELFAFDWDGPALGIASFKSEDESHLRTVVLKYGTEVRHPIWIDLLTDGFAHTYGTEWVLDLGRAEDYPPGNIAGGDAPGDIVVSGTNEHVLIRAGTDGTSLQHRPHHYDLRTMRNASRTADVSSAALIRRWSIWVSETDIRREGGTPIFTFDSQVFASRGGIPL